MPEAIERLPRTDDSAADARSLEELGRLDPQSIPASLPGQPPVGDPAPPPPLDLADEQEAAALNAALADAGMAATPEDRAAVQALTRLDPDTVAAVTRWLRTKPKGTTK
jgi:hypothetical protein